MKISEMQENARWLCNKHQWAGSVDDRFKRLVAELGELSTELCAENVDNRRVAFEIYDVVWNACDLANKLGFELEPYFFEKRDANAVREW